MNFQIARSIDSVEVYFLSLCLWGLMVGKNVTWTHLDSVSYTEYTDEHRSVLLTLHLAPR